MRAFTVAVTGAFMDGASTDDEKSRIAAREPVRLTRRQMLHMSGTLAAGGLLGGCGPILTTAPTATPTQVPAAQVPATGVPQSAAVSTAALATGHVVVMHFLDEFTEDMVNAFQVENPGISVEVIQVDLTRFNAMVAMGSPPDILRVEAPSIPQYLARDVLFDLTPYFEVSEVLRVDDLAPANNYYKANGPLAIGEGEIYGMCMRFSPDCTIFVYKRAFRDAGLDVPGDANALSCADIARLSQQLTRFEGDRLVMCGYGYEQEWTDRLWMNMAAELGKIIYTEDYGELNLLGDEDVKAIARYYYDLAADRLTYSVINPSLMQWFGTDFTQGTLAMAQCGFGYGAMAESDANRGEVTMIPAPMWADVRRDPALTAPGAVVTKATKVPDAAWKVFEYHNGGQPALDRAISGRGVPALKSLWELVPNSTEFEQQKRRVLQGELDLQTPPLQFNPFLGETVVADSWNMQLGRALQGEITFDDVLANVEAEVNAAIQDGMARVL